MESARQGRGYPTYQMKEKICDSCGTEFEIEAGDDSAVCMSCAIELQRETREERQLRKASEVE